jgi:TatD DNase family protein
VFDSHCHLHDRRVADPDAEIARAKARGVDGLLLAGVDPEGWLVEERLRAAHPEIAIAFGVHPQLLAEISDEEADAMVRALGEALARKPAAIGEIGLDGYGERRASLDRQERIFRAQLALARQVELPVVFHVLEAHARVLAILRADGLPRAGGVMHSYSGSAELVREYVALGLSISFAGPVCNAHAPKIVAAAKATPIERLLVETDAPFQTPAPCRPAQNEPSFLVEIVAALAQIRGESAEALARSTAANARRLFGIAT